MLARSSAASPVAPLVRATVASGAPNLPRCRRGAFHHPVQTQPSRRRCPAFGTDPPGEEVWAVRLPQDRRVAPGRRLAGEPQLEVTVAPVGPRKHRKRSSGSGARRACNSLSGTRNASASITMTRRCALRLIHWINRLTLQLRLRPLYPNHIWSVVRRCARTDGARRASPYTTV